MVIRFSRKEAAFVRSARVAHLATADANGQPHIIPICYVFDGKEFFSPIDEKPKRTEPRKLKRLRNIEANPNVTLVIDRYDEDWQKLAYVLIFGEARILLRGKTHRQAVKRLRRKYPQYQAMALEDRPIIMIRPKKVANWGQL